MKDFMLTEEQRRFAEEKHDVVVKFLNDRELLSDEYYDVVVFGYLKAVKLYDEQNDLKANAFEEVAISYMNKAINNHFSKLKREAQNVTVLSLDYPVGRTGLTFGEVMPDKNVDVCKEVCRKLSRAGRRYRLSHTYSIRPTSRCSDLMEVA